MIYFHKQWNKFVGRTYLYELNEAIFLSNIEFKKYIFKSINNKKNTYQIKTPTTFVVHAAT